MEINTSSPSGSFAHASQVKLIVLGGCGNKVNISYLLVTESIN